MTTPIIEIEEAGIRFGTHWALSRINLTINRGESVALFGPNGSGKSTLLKMVATLLPPTRGFVKVAGFNVQKDKGKIRELIRYLAHEKQLYESLTVLENLKLPADMRRDWVNIKPKEPENLLEQTGIVSYQNHKVGELSEGTKKRLMMARLLLGNGELFLLDEPHPTLDAQGREILHNMIRRWQKEGKTVVQASHDREQTLSHANRMIVFKEGAIDYDGKPK